MNLRPVTLQDASLLLQWRNDPVTRLASHNTQEITLEDHFLWLKKLLENSNRRLFIAEVEGLPIGTVRADLEENGVTELSWTIAPEARGKGFGKEMVALLAKQIQGPIRAEIKVGNISSIKIAEFSGLKFSYEKDGIMHYSNF